MSSKTSNLSRLNKSKLSIIDIKNSAGNPDTRAQIVMENKIDYEPKVSVIIPVYNVEDYLRECLDSVVNQTLREIEIICVDDGSTDKSLDILLEYAEKDNRITVLKQENLYAGVARNAGLAVARGEYLSFLDSDDFFELNMLEEMYKKAKKDGSDIVVCNAFKVVDGELQEGIFVREKNIKNDIFSCYEEYPASHIFQTIYGFPWNKLFSHSLINDYKIHFSSINHHNDTSFVMSSLVAAKQISYIPAKYIYYRYRDTSLCHAAKDVSCMYNSLSETYHFISKLKNYKNVECSFINYVLEFIIYYYLKKTAPEKIQLLPYINKLYDELEIKKYPIDFYNNISNYKKLENIVDYYHRRKSAEKDILIRNQISYEPKVSIIIPIYNVEAYLRECLDSVVNQTLREIEIICINDGSPDNSLQILQEYAAKDYRITVVYQENKGLGASRNVGFSLANSPYVFFLDSDDFIKHETIENLYNRIEETQSELCQYLAYRYDNLTKKTTLLPDKVFNSVRHKKGTYSYKANPKLMFEQVEAWKKLYKTEFLIKYGIKFFENSYYEDTLAHIKCMTFARKVCFDDNAYMYYRCNREGQITGASENTDKFLDIFNYINGAEEFLNTQNCFNKVKRYYYAFAVRRICSYYSRCSEETKVKFAEKVKIWLQNKNILELINCAPEKRKILISIIGKNNNNFKVHLFFPYYLLSTYILRRKKEKLLSKQKPAA